MRGLTCRRCGTRLTWDETSPILACPVCGTRYRMHPRTTRGGVGVGAGTVSPIQTTQGQYAGIPMVQSYVPKGWKTNTAALEAESNILLPLTPQIEYASPDGKAFITYTGLRGYDHLEPIPQNAQMQGRVSPSSKTIGLAYREAGVICDGIVQGNPNLSDARLLSESGQPDVWARKVIQTSLKDYASSGMINPGASWSKKTYAVRDRNGRTWQKLIEAMVTYAFIPVSPAEQQLYQMALRTMRVMVHPIQPPQPKLRWIVNYVLETSAMDPAFSEARQYHDQIRNSFELLPTFHQEFSRIRDALVLQNIQETNAVNDALSQMNRDNMASWDRRQGIIRDASNYGTQVMREMRESTARTHDRAANLRSETIREVNTYYTNHGGYDDPRVVEASTQWDHVYQNRQNPDVYAASTGAAPLEFGVDFEELRQTDGDY